MKQLVETINESLLKDKIKDVFKRSIGRIEKSLFRIDKTPYIYINITDLDVIDETEVDLDVYKSICSDAEFLMNKMTKYIKDHYGDKITDREPATAAQGLKVFKFDNVSNEEFIDIYNDVENEIVNLAKKTLKTLKSVYNEDNRNSKHISLGRAFEVTIPAIEVHPGADNNYYSYLNFGAVAKK